MEREYIHFNASVRCPESLEPESLTGCFARGTLGSDKADQGPQSGLSRGHRKMVPTLDQAESPGSGKGRWQCREICKGHQVAAVKVEEWALFERAAFQTSKEIAALRYGNAFTAR